MSQSPCRFTGGGPLDGERKLVNDEWDDVRIATAPRSVMDPVMGVPLIAVPNYSVYVRSDIDPKTFIFEPNMPHEDDISGSL